MRLQNILTGAIALAFVTAARADVTVEITGATAFRAAALDTIKAQYVASGQPFKFAYDTTGSFNGSNRSVWIGTFPGVAGTTTIRTSFNGSVEGIRALVTTDSDPVYLDPSVLNSVTAVVGGNNGGNGLNGQAGPNAAAQSEIAFSDAAITATPFASLPILPADAACGVVVFTMLANESAPANLTNVTEQQFRALWTNGFQPLSLLTGNSADTSLVFATGRNDGSGTRTTYLAETGYGVRNTVQQYVVSASTASEITEIQRVPAGGGATPSNASTVWGQDVDGNGGYFSGSVLRTEMAKTTPNVTVRDADGSVLDTIPLTLVTWLTVTDAVNARANGAKILGYNGVTLESLKTANVIDATDRAKVTTGQYAAWSFQQLYRRSTVTSGDALTVYNALRNNIGANILNAGIPLNEMTVGRVGGDGGIIAP